MSCEPLEVPRHEGYDSVTALKRTSSGQVEEDNMSEVVSERLSLFVCSRGTHLFGDINILQPGEVSGGGATGRTPSKNNLMRNICGINYRLLS